MRSNKIYIPLIIGLALGTGILIGIILNTTDSREPLFSSNANKEKLNRLVDFIERDYVDDINTDSIVDHTVNRILENLDPHSIYIPKEEIAEVNERMKGDFVGIGINFYTYKDTIAVIRAFNNGPGFKAGLKSGDRILSADNETLYGSNFSNTEIISKLKGPINSKVNLTVYRKNTNKTFTVEVVRDVVPIKSVDAAYMLTESLGYIKLNRFAESSFSEFKSALTKLQKLGAKAMVLDVRDNPGGILTIAKAIVDEFLEDKKLIYFTKERSGRIIKSLATDSGDFESGKTYVLINENSASASELLAGAIQDNDKGTIVGRRSFGKGLVQREMELGDGSVVRLTVARYYTPTGRSIQRPYDNGKDDYFDEYYKRIESGEFMDPENIEVNDSLIYKTPLGKIVYGGGGIIPDVFVPIDNVVENPVVNFLVQQGIINFFAFEHLENNRASYVNVLKQDFFKSYEVPNSLVNDLEDYLSSIRNTKVSLSDYDLAVKRHLKAALAGQLYGEHASVEVLNETDPVIIEVIALNNKG